MTSAPGATVGLLLVLGLYYGTATTSAGSQTTAVASTRPADEPWFTDRAEEVGLDFVHFNGMSGEFYLSEMMGPGAALFDFDNDGDLDIYIVQGQMLGSGKTLDQAVFPPEVPLPVTDRLYRNDLEVHLDGTRTLRFTEVTAGSGLGVRSYGIGVATGDFDNDGWVDVYRTAIGPNQLFHNNGDGTFSDVTRQTGTSGAWFTASASFVDIDRDGWLDLYVANYFDQQVDGDFDCAVRTGEHTYCGPERYQPVPDRLYRNQGDGTFVDVTATAQVAGEYGRALGVVTADLNGDGWVDIYVANDSEPNQLWLNQHDGTFVNDALLAGVAVNSAGLAEGSMGVDAGDFDADGDEDLFMTHVTGETNTLYTNDGSGLFEDRSTMVGLGAPSLAYTGFGTGWLDFDNDGWLDLLVANGAVRAIEAQVQAKEPHPLRQPNQLYRNLGIGRFEEVSRRAGAVFELSEVSRGTAFGDIDNDGDQDVLITNNSGRARLLINNVGHRNRWLGLRLVGGSTVPTLDPEPSRRVEGRDMLGARVGVFRDTGPPLWRRAHTDGSYASANDPRVLVGLGEATIVRRVRVIWPSGRVEDFGDVSVDQWQTLTEGTGL